MSQNNTTPEYEAGLALFSVIGILFSWIWAIIWFFVRLIWKIVLFTSIVIVGIWILFVMRRRLADVTRFIKGWF